MLENYRPDKAFKDIYGIEFTTFVEVFRAHVESRAFNPTEPAVAPGDASGPAAY